MLCVNCGNKFIEGALFCHVCGSKPDESQRCANCKHRLLDGAEFCQSCGHRVTSKKGLCHKCGYKLIENAAFCQHCGEKADIKNTVKIEKDFCKTCGEKLLDGAVFCQKCGSQTNVHNVEQNEPAEQIKQNIQITTKLPLEVDIPLFIKRGWHAVEDSEWELAEKYFMGVLDVDPENSVAYVGRLCVELKVNYEADISKYRFPIENMPNYKKAVRYADDEYRAKLKSQSEIINRNFEAEQEHRKQITEQTMEQERVEQERRHEEELIQKQKQLEEEQQRREQDALRQQRLKEREVEKQQREKQLIEQRLRDEERQSHQWAERGLCRYCGGQLIGILKKQCEVCKSKF
jgi:flagellar biosynthesis GTPase FlhF